MVNENLNLAFRSILVLYLRTSRFSYFRLILAEISDICLSLDAVFTRISSEIQLYSPDRVVNQASVPQIVNGNLDLATRSFLMLYLNISRFFLFLPFFS